MRKVTDVVASERSGPLFICDFSPPRGGPPEAYTDAAELTSDFISVAYNPGRAVRTDSVAVAAHITATTGTDAIFNLSPRDMNKIALQSRLLGAQLLSLSNVIVVQGDKITERDNTQAVADYTSTGLVEAIAQLNSGVDFRSVNLRAPTDFCIGAALDLGRGVESEARLAYRRVLAGAHFFITQAVFNPALITEFNAAYAAIAGSPLDRPVFWGLQILMADGVLFSNVPEDLTRDLANGRDGVDIAIETYALLAETGIDTIYLVAPIMRGGARDYKAARRFLDAVRM